MGPGKPKVVLLLAEMGYAECEAEGALLPKTVVPTAVGNSYYRRQNYKDTQKF